MGFRIAGGLVVAMAAVVAGAFAVHHASGAAQEARPQAAAAEQAGTHELRFGRDAPQLNYVKSEPVELLPEPLLDPLNARIAYDENHTSRVFAPVAGRVTRIVAQPGDTVKAGAPLAWLDAPDFGAALSDVAKAEADAHLKQKAYARTRELVDAGVTPRKDLDASESDVRQSEAELARARLRARNLSPAGAAAQGEALALRSAVGGVVAERNINPGTELRPDAAQPAFVVTDPRHLWVLIDLPEKYLGKVRVGQAVDVEVDAYPGRRFRATVAQVGAVLDAQTRRIPVRCSLDNADGLLKPEMYARVTPLAEGDAKFARVPNGALLAQGLYSYVFVEKEPGVFEKRQVAPGLQGYSYTYVRDGLAPGERVVVSGASLLNSELAGTN
jgi:cobalt-zinc-cadmium efflux system membrane fusion protein